MFVGTALVSMAAINKNNRLPHVDIRPEWRPYPWLNNIKSARMPFYTDKNGKYTIKSLFHNPHCNFIPGKGYEDGHNEEKPTIVIPFDHPVDVEELYQRPFETHDEYVSRQAVIYGYAQPQQLAASISEPIISLIEEKSPMKELLINESPINDAVIESAPIVKEVVRIKLKKKW